MKKQIVILMLVGVLTAGVSLAKGDKGNTGACKEDRKKICTDVKKHDCLIKLQENLSDLTPACQEQIKKNPCNAYKNKFCGEVVKGEGRIIECYTKNYDNVSDLCKTHLTTKFPCFDDKRKFCADINGKKEKGCLKEHQEELSEACKTKIADRKANKKKS